MKDQKLQIAMLVGEVQTLSYMINAFTDYCVFCRYYGHVDQISVDVGKSKEDYNTNLVSAQFYMGSNHSESKKVIKQLNTTVSELKKILKDNKIDYTGLTYDIEEVRHYKLV